MDVKGVQGTVSFDGEWITVTKTPVGPKSAPFRIRATDVTGTRLKKATRLKHGYVQFLLPGAEAAGEQNGMMQGGRPPATDPHSLSISHKSNDLAEALIAAVEQARG